MTTIKNVAIVGGSGNLGREIVKAVLRSGFNVTALTRQDSKSTFPDGVRVYKTNYDSESSLADAFKGQDTVVSVIATAALALQLKIIEVAARTGVKRFIPTEFGVNVVKLEESGTKKILGEKVKARELLERIAAGNKDFTWTGISTNLFFDWGFPRGSFGLDVTNKAATIYDSGNESFTATNLATIGAAVSSVLTHPAETANKYIDISSFRTSQNEILSVVEEETGTKWKVTNVKTDGITEKADAKLAKGDFSAFGDYLKVHFFRDGEGKSVSDHELWNELLGLPKDDLRESIRKVLS